jgi:hypothetical protein
MAIQLTAEDARQSLSAHAAARGIDLREKYGPHIGWGELLRVLEDRAFARYPCEIVFEAEGLLPGEFAHPEPRGSRPEDGFRMCVHPLFLGQLERVPWLVLYQLAAVNYGEFASAEDAESFGAAALGLAKEDYYQGLCQMADQLAAGAEPAPIGGGLPKD